MVSRPLQLVVGIDALDRARGALSFASLLHRQDGAVVTPVHVVELAPEVFPEWVTSSTRAWSAEVARATVTELAPELGPMELLEAMPPEVGLAEAARHLKADAVIVGRKARSNEIALVRLGGVARRMLRELHQAVVVVPPEFRETDHTSQPILVATDLSAGAMDATRMARRLAAVLDVSLVVIHVARALPPLPPGIDFETRSRMIQQGVDQRRNALDAWCLEADLPDVERHTLTGDALAGLQRAIDDHEPMMVVTGSRRLGEVRRIFSTSVGSALAASSPVPVVVVPRA